ncbi:hypothetical protein CSHISOI_07100 [Colletotrichum shisoi]|uniref:Uncharacterized protein n=1 Tax=Colletotrichum shisoi TaxID=2078593 RepID=A0A5Q4BN10_9PEZI|nr:hypothetical protein CSHISOI_07100 [Colletotrichum shisoi]
MAVSKSGETGETRRLGWWPGPDHGLACLSSWQRNDKREGEKASPTPAATGLSFPDPYPFSRRLFCFPMSAPAAAVSCAVCDIGRLEATPGREERKRKRWANSRLRKAKTPKSLACGFNRFGSGSNVSEQRSGCDHPAERFAKQGAACEVSTSTLAAHSSAGSGPQGDDGRAVGHGRG